MSTQIIRRSNYLSMPWKNGAGITEEIARMPASGERFDWRLSLASIGQSGPFSSYVGYCRSVTLIAGDGFRLDIAGQGAATLDQVGKTCLFGGEAQTTCTLLGGACRDLSLMVRSPGQILSVAPVSLGARGHDLVLDASAHHALFSLGEGAVQVAVRGTSGAADRLVSPTDMQLLPNDSLLVEPGVPCIVVQGVQGASTNAALLCLSWRSA